MKDFVKMVLAVICGLVIISLVTFVIGIGAIGVLSAGSKSTPSIPESGVLKMDLADFSINEQSKSASFDPTSLIMGGGLDDSESIGIWDAIQAINTAATDPAVKYIYLKTDAMSIDITTAEEVRKALNNFRQTSGKAIVSYMESPSTGSYYLASVADKVYMTEYEGSSIMITGVNSTMMFLGDLFNKLGINMQLIRHGKYKSAGEMYTRGSSSPENRAQNQRMIDSLWETMAAQIAESRGITVEELNSYIDDLKLNLPQDMIDCKLADELMTRSELQQQLADLALEEEYKDVKMIAFADYVNAKKKTSTAKKEIAVIYADGEIIDGADANNIDGNRFASVISKVRADSTVKAVVLRVNSPGGSVFASEQIKVELDSLKKVKPVIASYGSYAASGGYWISNNCDKIFSAATTLTGSIGVFSLIPDISKTLKDIASVNIEQVSSNKNGSMLSLTSPLNEEQTAYMQRSVESIYDLFITYVSEGRSMSKEDVDEIAQGRVWTGADALGINLVDEIGSIEDAVAYAAELAGDAEISNWKIGSYPRTQSQMESLLSMFGKNPMDEEALINKLKEISKPSMAARLEYKYIFE